MPCSFCCGERNFAKVSYNNLFSMRWFDLLNKSTRNYSNDDRDFLPDLYITYLIFSTQSVKKKALPKCKVRTDDYNVNM